MKKAKASEIAYKGEQKWNNHPESFLVFSSNSSVLHALMEYDVPDRENWGQHNLLPEVIQLNIMANNCILKQEIKFFFEVITNLLIF